LLKGSSTAFVFRIFGGITGYIFILLITRNLGADALGVYALSLTVIGITSVIGKLGLDTALLRFVAEYSSQGRKDLVKDVYIHAVRICIPLGIFLSLFIFFASPYIARYIFMKVDLSPYFKIASFGILPAIMISLNSESLRGFKKIKEYAFLGNIAMSFFASLILLTLLSYYKSDNLPVISYIIASLCVLGISTYLWVKNLDIKAKISNIVVSTPLLRVSLPMLLTSSMWLIMGWTDTIMLGIFRPKSDVGIYNVALRISALTGITLGAINTIAAPKFAEFFGRGDMKGLEQTVRHSTKLIFWTSFSAFLVIFIFPSFILGIFGQEFKIGIYALMLLTFGQFVNSISGSVGYILQMTGKQKIFQNIIIFATIINIILNYLLIPRYGINGAAIASMVSMILWNFLSMVYIKSYFNISTLYIPLLSKKI